MGTYDDPQSLAASFDAVKASMGKHGVKEVFVKKLSSNDNSKNQPYFGSDLSQLSFIPTGPFVASNSRSNKNSKSSIKFHAPISFSWLDIHGDLYPAPNAKLIFYPQYPEVRFSGFALRSKVNVSEWMNPDKSGRDEGRWLILGVNGPKVFGYLAVPHSVLAGELQDYFHPAKPSKGPSLFQRVSLSHESNVDRARDEDCRKSSLLSDLYGVHARGWVRGMRLTTEQGSIPYYAQNAGGYTLEALLGITPNSRSEPDYLGWEIKQYGVTAFPHKGARVTTLMTPEPDIGEYADGILPFIAKYGYPDTHGEPDRYNFGGVHRAKETCSKTGLTLVVDGYDPKTSTILDATGAVRVLDRRGGCAAGWSFAKLVDIWKRKHNSTAYIPCQVKKNSDGSREFRYGNIVKLCTGAKFELLLKGIARGFVYYDPGIKVTQYSSPSPKIKSRNQLRSPHKRLSDLYQYSETVDLCNMPYLD